MANNNEYFGGVMRIALYDLDTGALAVEANSLTESTFTVGSESTEVRGGQGYVLEGKYYHTTSVSLKLTDSLYRPEYVAMKVGSTIQYGADMMVIESLKVTSNKLTLPTQPQEFDGKLIAWVKKVNETTWQTKEITKTDDTYTIDYTDVDNADVCVKYVKYDANAKKVTINSNFVPSTYHLIGIAQRFSGQKYLGETVFDIPQFQLDPSFELSMSANGVSTMDVSGSALPVMNTTTCDSSTSIYCTLIDKDKEGNWYDEANQIVAYPPTLEMATGETATVQVKALFGNPLIAPSLVENSELTYSIASSSSSIATVSESGVVTAVGAGEAKLLITATDKPELTETVVISVA